jgi:hypothetical protein
LESGLKRLTVPGDFCQLLTEDCKATPGCGTAFFADDVGNNATFCYSNALSKPPNPCDNDASSGALHYSNGVQVQTQWTLFSQYYSSIFS